MSMSKPWGEAIGRQSHDSQVPPRTDQGAPATAAQWAVDLPDPERDLALARQAVAYLREHGLDDGTIVQCLRDEFEIDLPTAERMAGPPGGMGHREAAAG
jgi:hypothetical protein